jgi:[ribosomal protein S18]-alanine N-acetyltransferase
VNPRIDVLSPPVTEGDRVAVLALEAASQQRPLGWEALAQELGDGSEGAITLVARGVDGTVIGHASARRLVDDVHVVRLVVGEQARRQHIGRALLEGLIAWAEADGAPRITLEVRATNVAALALYAAAGLIEVGHRPGYYPDGEDAVVCTRDLGSTSGAADGGR